MKLIFTVFIVVMSTCFALGQPFTTSPEIMSSVGGSGAFNNMDVDWTLGEAIIGMGGYSNDVTNGFQQGFLCGWLEDTTFVWSPVNGFDSLGNPITWYEITDTLYNQFHQYNAIWCYVSVEEVKPEPDWSLEVFPNPVEHLLNVIIPEGIASDGELYLMDINGKVITHFKVINSKLELDLQNLGSGVYILNYINSSGSFKSTHKIIKL